MLKRQKEVLQHLLDNEEAVLKALEKHYSDALEDINMAIRIMQSDELTQSKVYRIQYQQSLKKQVEGILEKLHSDEYSTVQQFLSSTYTDAFVGTMYDLHAQKVPVLIPVDRKNAVKAVLTDSKLTSPLYDELGIDINSLKKTIRAEITRGIASGMTFDDIARNIASVSKAPMSRAKSIARTEGHRIQQASMDDARMAAKAKGADVVKQWDSTMDGATRPTHKALDGQIHEVEERFEMHGKKAMYPGDFGDPAEDCNCRCAALTRARKALDADELKTLQERAEFFGLDKTKDFAEFKEKYLKAAETIEKPKEKAYNSIVEMLQKSSAARKNFKFISDERFDQLTIAARKQGATIMRGTDEIEEHLNAMGASASTIGDVLLFKKDVCICEVLEETHHFMQNLRSMNNDKGEPLRTILNEIDAKNFVIMNAEKYKVPRNEVELMERQLASYQRQLTEYLKGGE